jgi:hypothetical protein
MAKLMKMQQPLKLDENMVKICKDQSGVTLSKNSKVLNGTAGDLSHMQTNIDKQTVKSTRKIEPKQSNESDFSTDESDSDANTPSLNLGSAAFYMKSPASSSNSRKMSTETSGDENTNHQEFGYRSDSHPKTRPNIKNTPIRNGIFDRNTRCTNGHEPSVIKQRKMFDGRQEKHKPVESYKAKKKTELCRNWENTRKWKFGDLCAFAHGKQELELKNHVPENYKTKVCKQFHEEGFCAYGNRCQFIHLGIQKKMKKLRYSDTLKESTTQYETRSKASKASGFEDIVINAFKPKRLNIFEQICPQNERKMKNTDEYLTDSWMNSENHLMALLG